MWHNQELLYKIRRMTLDDFLREFNNEIEMKKLYEWLKRASDLNIQRNQLIDEIDKLIVQMIKDALEGKELDDGKYIQRKHKTY